MGIKNPTENKKDSQSAFRPFRSAATEEEPLEKKEFISVTRKDLYLMSFFGFLTGGILILGLIFLTGAITGNALLGLPGEKEVVLEETTASVIEPVINETIEETTVPVVEEIVEEVVEEVIVEESDPCGPENEVILLLNDPYDYNGREVELKLASDFSAQISVGGKKELISVGESLEINGLDLSMVDGSEAEGSATIYFDC